MSSIFRVKIEARMSGYPPPFFTLVTSKKRSSKAAKSAAMLVAVAVTSATVTAAMLAAGSTAKSAVVRGTAEGQSPEKGKVKSSGLDPSSEGPSRPENSVRISRTSSGKVAARLSPLANSGRISEETKLAVGRNGCHKCKSGHYCGLSNEVKIWVEAEVKTGKTLDGIQVKREELNSWKTLKSLLDLRRQLLYSKEMF